MRFFEIWKNIYIEYAYYIYVYIYIIQLTPLEAFQRSTTSSTEATYYSY